MPNSKVCLMAVADCQIASIALNPSHKFITTLGEDANNTHEHVTQEILVVEFNDIVAATYEVLRKEAEKGNLKGETTHPDTDLPLVMVFLPTARSASIYNEIFSNLHLSYPTWEIHSRMSQSARGKATEAFRNATQGVLFSSDVTARGIDVKGVTAVVQVGLPSNEEQCESHASFRCSCADLSDVHRLGRTARAGEEGHGILILGSFETHFLRLGVIRALPLQTYPAITGDALQSAHHKVSSALQHVSNTAKAQAYQAWLGYYNSSTRVLGWDKADLVEWGNQYALEVLAYDDGGKLPPMEAKTVGKMGLKGVKGLNVTSGQSGQRQGGFSNGQGNGGGRGGFGAGGGGRGGGGAGRGRPIGSTGGSGRGGGMIPGSRPNANGNSGEATNGNDSRKRRRPANP
jgi:ATP-dependent RNA helicase MSS116